ncbi:MAG: 30S ribosomal protein S6 [Xenococcaceae cyanobacterium MO_234.B1]|nr:30S ribosomal protein S6 [Xenococcaceae cyanobacterium MO_234.B1]
MSKYYEMMYILRPDLSDEQVTEAINKYQQFLSDHGETNITIQNRGKKRLAYPIKKYLDGIYIQMNWQGTGQANASLERAMRLGEEVIRYLTLKLDKPPVAVAEEASESVATETEEIVEA